MVNRLPAIIPCVYYCPEAFFIQPMLPGQLPYDSIDMGQQLPIGLSQLQECGYVPLRDEEEVNRGLGVNVLKGQHRIILVDDFTWDFFSHDATEDTLGHDTNTPLP